MAILTERKSWTRPESCRRVRATFRFTDAEQENVRAALLFLHRRYASIEALAEALKLGKRTVDRALALRRGRITSVFAMHLAELAGAPVGDVLAGRWPAPGSCPTCGRC